MFRQLATIRSNIKLNFHLNLKAEGVMDSFNNIRLVENKVRKETSDSSGNLSDDWGGGIKSEWKERIELCCDTKGCHSHLSR